MYNYKGIETQEQFDERQNYLKTVDKDTFLLNDDTWFYAREVKNGNIPVCEYVKFAIDRELSKLNDPDCPYYFDPDPGYRFFKFCRYNSHLKGPLGGQPFILSDWQIWAFSMMLGWKHKSGQKKGYRQYSITYLECPRGSGKSAMMALLGLYMLTLDNEWEPEVYVAATKKDQANLLFNSVVRQVEFHKNRRLVKQLQVRRKREYLECKSAKAGTFKSLSRDSKSFDGMNIHCALVDEIHAHKDSEIWDVLKSGANKRNQSMMVGITTAGTNYNGFGFSYSKFIKTLLTGEVEDDSIFALVYTKDKDDDIYSRDTWVKANPAWYASINHNQFEADIKRTLTWTETKSETYTKLLNVWYQANDKWLTPELINSANTLTLPESDFKDDECIIGVDLAYAEDMLSYVKVYERFNEDDGKYHYYVYPVYYSPQSLIDKDEKKNYLRWYGEGLLNSTPGDIVDFDIIQDKLSEEYYNTRLYEFAFDRYNAHQMAGSLQKSFGENMVIYCNQSMSGLNEATKFFKRLMIENRIHFNHEIFSWNCLNAHVVSKDGLIKISKDPKSPDEKIDGLAAALNALDRFMIKSNEEYSYEVIEIERNG